MAIGTWRRIVAGGLLCVAAACARTGAPAPKEWQSMPDGAVRLRTDTVAIRGAPYAARVQEQYRGEACVYRSVELRRLTPGGTLTSAPRTVSHFGYLDRECTGVFRREGFWFRRAPERRLFLRDGKVRQEAAALIREGYASVMDREWVVAPQ